MLYFGSCRYMHGHGGKWPWNCWAGRLHSTREIHQIINIFNGDYTKWIDRFSKTPESIWLLNDLGHSGVGWGWEDSGLTIEPNKDPKQIKDIVIEVSSKKVDQVEYQNEPWWVGTHYMKVYHPDRDKWKAQSFILTEEDISEDIMLIRDLIKEKFHPEARLHVIPHLNLKKSATEGYIESRNELTNWLDAACNKHDVNFCNVGKEIEENYKKPWLDICMPDSTHYAASHGLVMEFINSKTTNK